MEKIVCGPENVKAFNRQMKELVPEFHAVAKQLHAAGLINGLRGVTLEIGNFLTPAIVAPQPESEIIRHCQDCRHWVRDTVGFGSGIGSCLLNSRPAVLKWPEQSACVRFEVIA